MEIKRLTEETISRISAGEVIERPLNVVKELVENSIDAGASAVTVEIRDGGITMVRVTDNGCGIERDQITRAFVRHATSKIRDAEDLSHLSSLGFRGEALASIAAVAQVEMITKVRGELTGTRAVNDHLAAYDPDAPVEITLEEIGAPDGTTVIVRNLFGSIPVRRKFLRQPQTEAGYITDLMEKQALSHPDISFHYRVNGQEKLHTTGNGSLKELVYRIYGRETAAAIVPLHAEDAEKKMVLDGLIGRPEISRSSRSFETFFINGRMLRSRELSAGLEEGYRTDLMQHRFPFAVLHLTMPPEDVDVNVHPSKMEVRFSDRAAVIRFLDESVHGVLKDIELIPRAVPESAKEERARKLKEARIKAQKLNESPRYEAFEAQRTAGVRPQDRPAEPGDPPRGSALYAAPAPAGGFLFEDRRPYGQGGLPGTVPATPARAEDSLSPEYSGTPVAEPASPPALEESMESMSGQGSFPFLGGALSKNTEQMTLAELHTEGGENDASLSGNPGDPGLSEQLQENAGTARPGGSAPEESGPAEHRILSANNAPRYRFIGQIFETYWLIEFERQLLIIDQHAAHEKVNFERMMRRISREHPALDAEGSPREAVPEEYLALDRLLEEGREGRKAALPEPVFVASQQLLPPVVLRLSGREEAAYREYSRVFAMMGYEIEDFGGGSYAMRAVPTELFGQSAESLLRETLEEIMSERISGTPRAVLSKVASMSCKAAVKGNRRLSDTEARALIDELLTLENPYHCPHGRPTMIVMHQHDMDRKFRRIV